MTWRDKPSSAAKIKPLAEILQIVRDKLPGEVAGVKLERKHGRLVYEFRVVGARGPPSRGLCRCGYRRDSWGTREK